MPALISSVGGGMRVQVARCSRTLLDASLGLLVLSASAGQATGQSTPLPPVCTQPTGGDPNRPFPVCDARPVITHGPYLSAPTDTSATIVWMTDLPSHSKVIYGVGDTLNRESVPTKDGMTPVGRLHTVRLTGLRPGQSYRYRVVSTPVLELNSYWSKKGIELRSEAYTFRTFDPTRSTAAFASISDTHENVARIDSIMRNVDWSRTDFLVHTGDAFDGVRSETQVWERWLDPMISGGLGHSRPLIFARGNHDTRGPFARDLTHHVPIEDGRFFYSRDIGPVHLIVVDTGEDKPDTTQVYARLNFMEEYRKGELAWLQEHARSSARLRDAPFRVLVMHQPSWGWVSGDNAGIQAAWTAAANEARVDLVIAGHRHRFSLTRPGGQGANTYPILVVGQGQVAKVDATATGLRVQVVAASGATVSEFTVTRRNR